MARPFPPCISGYRLVQRVGRDRMSEWFRAIALADERANEPPIGDHPSAQRAPYREPAATPPPVLLRRVCGGGLDEALLAESVTAARFYTTLDHPNIATVESFEIDAAGDVWCRSDWLEGVSLRALMQRGRRAGLPMPTAAVLQLGLAIAKALAHVHDHRLGDGLPLGLFLRILDPQVVFIEHSGAVKLIGCGLAQLAHSFWVSARLEPDDVAYLSPEQATGQALDAGSDLFSLGTLLWELTRNAPLFHRADLLATVEAIRDVSLPDDEPEALPAGLSLLLERLLRRRDARIASAEEAARVLRRVGQQLGLDEHHGRTALAEYSARLTRTLL
jgi:serine/threonine protein kinase